MIGPLGYFEYGPRRLIATVKMNPNDTFGLLHRRSNLGGYQKKTCGLVNTMSQS